jgi:hypothetical protein
VAVGDRRPSRLLWGLIAVEAAVIAIGPHESTGQILAVCTVAVLLFAGLIGVLEWTGRAASPGSVAGPARPGPQPAPAGPVPTPAGPVPGSAPAAEAVPVRPGTAAGPEPSSR